MACGFGVVVDKSNALRSVIPSLMKAFSSSIASSCSDPGGALAMK